MTTRTSQSSEAARNKPQQRSRRRVAREELIARKEATIARLKAQVVRLVADRESLRAKLRATKSEGKVRRRGARGTSEPIRSTMPPTDSLPPLPAADANGHYPAVEYAYASLARTIITRRLAAGWTQAELAAKAGVRTETVNRLESGRHSPNVRTVDKIDAALKGVGV